MISKKASRIGKEKGFIVSLFRTYNGIKSDYK